MIEPGASPPPHHPATTQPRRSYLEQWRSLSRPAWLYLLHAALLTSSLAIMGLFFNLLIVALGYGVEFLGLLNPVATAVAGALSLPLWWLVTRVGYRPALIASAAVQAVSAFVFALWPSTTPLLIGVSLGGVSAVLFQVSSPPFMMRHSDSSSRDHLFSANTAINIGLAGIGSLLAGYLPALFGRMLGVDAESALAYRATFTVAGLGLLLSLIPLLLFEDRTRGQGTRDREQGADDTILVTGDEHHMSPAPTNVRLTLRRRWSVVRGAWPAIIRTHARPVAQLLVSPFLISCGAALLIPYLNLFFKRQFAVPDQTLGQIFAVLGISTGLAALAAPVISGRIGKIGTVIAAQTLSIPFLLALGFVPLLPVAVGAAVVRGALFNMGSPLYDAFAMERTDEAARPAVIGLINAAYSAGYLIAPIISTRVQATYGFAPLFMMTAVCYSLAVLAKYWFFVRPDQRREKTARNMV